MPALVSVTALRDEVRTKRRSADQAKQESQREQENLDTLNQALKDARSTREEYVKTAQNFRGTPAERRNLDAEIAAMTAKVNDRGQIGQSYDNKTPFVEWVAQDLIRAAAIEAIKARVEALRLSLEAIIEKQLAKNAKKCGLPCRASVSKRPASFSFRWIVCRWKRSRNAASSRPVMRAKRAR